VAQVAKAVIERRQRAKLLRCAKPAPATGGAQPAAPAPAAEETETDEDEEEEEEVQAEGSGSGKRKRQAVGPKSHMVLGHEQWFVKQVLTPTLALTLTQQWFVKQVLTLTLTQPQP